MFPCPLLMCFLLSDVSFSLSAFVLTQSEESDVSTSSLIQFKQKINCQQKPFPVSEPFINLTSDVSTALLFNSNRKLIVNDAFPVSNPLLMQPNPKETLDVRTVLSFNSNRKLIVN